MEGRGLQVAVGEGLSNGLRAKQVCRFFPGCAGIAVDAGLRALRAEPNSRYTRSAATETADSR
jgi:hypothetical protein